VLVDPLFATGAFLVGVLMGAAILWALLMEKRAEVAEMQNRLLRAQWQMEQMANKLNSLSLEHYTLIQHLRGECGCDEAGEFTEDDFEFFEGGGAEEIGN
jgi:hypothetical protein